MTKSELGVKRDCPECGARFYDLNKEPAHCPKCDHEFIPEALLKPRKPRREDESSETTDKPAASGEVSLEAADKEQRAATSKRKPAMDNEQSDDDDDDELEGLGDIDIDLDDDDDDDDDSLLDDDDSDDDDVKGIVSGGGDDDS